MIKRKLLIESVQTDAWRSEVKSGNFRPGEYAQHISHLKQAIKFIKAAKEMDVNELEKRANLTYAEWIEFNNGYKKYE